MGNSTLNICGYITLVFFVIVNVVCAILGIAAIGIGSHYVATHRGSTVLVDTDYADAVVLIVAGICIVLVCTAGIVGALFQWRPLLILYAVVLTIVVILDIIGAILAIAFRNRIGEGVDLAVEVLYSQYRVRLGNATKFQESATEYINETQREFKCCGYNNASDWIRWNPQALIDSEINGRPVPPGFNIFGSGCDECDPPGLGACMNFRGIIKNNITVSFNVSSEGCRDLIRDPIIHLAVVRGVVGIVFGLVESLPIFLAFGLCWCISSARKTEAV